MECSVCKEREASPELEGSYGRPICDYCFGEKQVDMEMEINNIEEVK